MTQPESISAPPVGHGAAALTIDRLRLRAAGLDEATARQLATLVAQALAPPLRLPIATTAIDTLRVELDAHPAEPPRLLAQRIADALRAALARGEEVAP